MSKQYYWYSRQTKQYYHYSFTIITKKYKKKKQPPPTSISSSAPQDILSNPIKASVFDFKRSTCCAGCNANPICVQQNQMGWNELCILKMFLFNHYRHLLFNEYINQAKLQAKTEKLISKNETTNRKNLLSSQYPLLSSTVTLSFGTTSNAYYFRLFGDIKQTQQLPPERSGGGNRWAVV